MHSLHRRAVLHLNSAKRDRQLDEHPRARICKNKRQIMAEP